MQCQAKFLSTLSLRRATLAPKQNATEQRDFYPRSPCGERLIDTSKDVIKTTNFYPRSPCGERLVPPAAACGANTISIHALLAESDSTKLPTGGQTFENFYPRSPCGERHRQRKRHPYPLDFYPRSPCGERHYFRGASL